MKEISDRDLVDSRRLEGSLDFIDPVLNCRIEFQPCDGINLTSLSPRIEGNMLTEKVDLMDGFKLESQTKREEM